MVVTLYLEELPRTNGHSGPVYSIQPLAEFASSAFALGCAIGVQFRDTIVPILEQTHPGEAEAIIEDCAGPLRAQILEVREEAIELNPEVFIGSVFEGLEDEEPIDLDATCNILSIAFEYGCVLAHVERGAAQVVRNSFNRRETVTSNIETSLIAVSGQTPPSQEVEQSRLRPIQEFAQELFSAYEAGIGFAQPLDEHPE